MAKFKTLSELTTAAPAKSDVLPVLKALLKELGSNPNAPVISDSPSEAALKAAAKRIKDGVEYKFKTALERIQSFRPQEFQASNAEDSFEAANEDNVSINKIADDLMAVLKKQLGANAVIFDLPTGVRLRRSIDSASDEKPVPNSLEIHIRNLFNTGWDAARERTIVGVKGGDYDQVRQYLIDPLKECVGVTIDDTEKFQFKITVDFNEADVQAIAAKLIEAQKKLVFKGATKSLESLKDRATAVCSAIQKSGVECYAHSFQIAMEAQSNAIKALNPERKIG